MKNKNIKKIKSAVTIAALVISIFSLEIAKAAELTNEKDTMTRLTASTLSSHDISFVLGGSTALNAGETITIDFGEDDSKFSVNGTSSIAGDFDFNDGTERTIFNAGASTDCTGSSGANDISVGINDTTGVVTFLACPSFSASSNGATVDIEYGTAATTGASGTNRVTNPAAGNDKTVAVAGTIGDSGSFAVSIISNDQVTVTATVESVFTFSLSSNTCALGTLSTASVSSCNYNVTTTTNAEDGYVTTIIEDGNLISGSNDINDISDGTVTAGSEEYGIALTGTDRAFADERAVTGSAQNIASDISGPISSQAVTVTHKASITSATIAGSYSHIVTLVSTGTF